MDCIFLNAAGQTLFVRSDMESGHWVQQEMSVNADFPFDPDKVIEIGQRIAFHDPATDNLEVFEIRNVINSDPDHYQQITAEHIAIAELSDEHINTKKITNKTAAQALTTALASTLWNVGTSTASGTQSADISRGSVWNAITTIQYNWNVYIIPRVVISAAGAITGRYLDIIPARGTFRGVRVSVRKNLLDPIVTYDDTDVLTALYGYGGNVTVSTSGQDDSTEELTFKDQVWNKTSSHPAKPSGQKYLEWPEKTAIYGRNGRPRYGYYQNGDITDGAVLLQKTWEALKKTADPKISIVGTCADLHRLGYKDQPLRLHDTAIVEIEETGEVFEKEIIMLDVDLVNPAGSRPEIGDYIPNIVYINRETNEMTTSSGGRGGGGGGGRGQTNKQKEESETWTAFEKSDERIAMVVGTRNGGYYIKAGQIALSINKSGESGSYETTAHINADRIFIGQDEEIDPAFQEKTLDKSLTAITTEFTTVNTLLAKKIEVEDITATLIQGEIAKLTVLQVASLDVTNGIECQDIDADQIDCTGLNTNSGGISCGDIDADDVSSNGVLLNLADASVSGNTLTISKVDGSSVTFNRAVTSTSWSWVGGSARISLQPQGQTFDSPAIDTYTLSGNPSYTESTKLIKQTVLVVDENGNTAKSLQISLNGTLAYNHGWNDCIDAATEVTRYTRTTGTYGGDSTVHYILQYGQYTNVGANWWKTTKSNAYTLPSKK